MAYTKSIDKYNVFKNKNNEQPITEFNKNKRLEQDYIYFCSDFDNNKLLSKQIMKHINKYSNDEWTSTSIVNVWLDYNESTNYLNDIFNHYIRKQDALYFNVLKVQAFYNKFITMNTNILITSDDINVNFQHIDMINQFVMVKIAKPSINMMYVPNIYGFVDSIKDFEIKYVRYLDNLIKTKTELSKNPITICKYTKYINKYKLVNFANEYARLLVKRLQHDSTNISTERIMWKTLCSISKNVYRCMHNMKKYFEDIAHCTNIVKMYNVTNKTEFYPTIYKKNMWSVTSSNVHVVKQPYIPVIMQNYIGPFTELYSNVYNKRKLELFNESNSHHYATISFEGLNKTYKLHINANQMLILMIIDEFLEINIKDIVTKLNMKWSMVSDIISVLVQSQVIVKHAHIYKINKEYTHICEDVILYKLTVNNNIKLSLDDKKEQIIKSIIMVAQEPIYEHKLFDSVQQNVDFDIEYEYLNSITMFMIYKKMIKICYIDNKRCYQCLNDEQINETNKNMLNNDYIELKN